MKNSMTAEEYYLHCLKDGPQKHSNLYERVQRKYGGNPTLIRNKLLAEGLIRESGSTKRTDGKTIFIYELTGKAQVKKVVEPKYKWEDGTPRSQGNAFDWKTQAKGLFGKGELAAIESGRKMGVNGRNYDQITVYSRAGA